MWTSHNLFVFLTTWGIVALAVLGLMYTLALLFVFCVRPEIVGQTWSKVRTHHLFVLAYQAALTAIIFAVVAPFVTILATKFYTYIGLLK